MRARFSAPVQTVPGAYPASCTMGTGSFLGEKRPGGFVDPPPLSKCRGHERVGLYLYSPFGLSWPVIGRAFTLTLATTNILNTQIPLRHRLAEMGNTCLKFINQLSKLFIIALMEITIFPFLNKASFVLLYNLQIDLLGGSM